jgi:hypothetical protein
MGRAKESVDEKISSRKDRFEALRRALGPEIVSKEFHFRETDGPIPIVAKLWKPVPEEEGSGPWVCLYAVEGLHEGIRAIYGVDGMQALILALKIIKSELDSLDEKNPGKLFWGDEPYGKINHWF